MFFFSSAFLSPSLPSPLPLPFSPLPPLPSRKKTARARAPGLPAANSSTALTGRRRRARAPCPGVFWWGSGKGSGKDEGERFRGTESIDCAQRESFPRRPMAAIGRARRPSERGRARSGAGKELTVGARRVCTMILGAGGGRGEEGPLASLSLLCSLSRSLWRQNAGARATREACRSARPVAGTPDLYSTPVGARGRALQGRRMARFWREGGGALEPHSSRLLDEHALSRSKVEDSRGGVARPGQGRVRGSSFLSKGGGCGCFVLFCGAFRGRGRREAGEG